MNLTDRILATILGTLVVWAITKVVTFFVERSRIKSAILTDLLLHQRGIKMQDQAIKAMFDNGLLKVGTTIPFPIRYASEEWILYRALQRDLPFYLPKETLRKIIKFYHLMWELDQSMVGFAKALDDWEADGRKLTDADIDHLQRRVARMNSMARLIFERAIKGLEDLPEDYQEAKTMETVLHRHNGNGK
jgi:hypothetical protein